jgi:hypothetical protein
MTSQQLELITRRGLTLPEPTLTRLRTVGIWCEANLTVQRRDQDWLIRGQESGGAVNDIGRYVGFCKEDGSALSWLQPVKNFMPNGLHAVLLAPGPIVGLDMYRFETSYDLLITSHTLAAEEGKPKPKLESKLIFFHRFGVLDRELWGQRQNVPRSRCTAVLLLRLADNTLVWIRKRRAVYQYIYGCARSPGWALYGQVTPVRRMAADPETLRLLKQFSERKLSQGTGLHQEAKRRSSCNEKLFCESFYWERRLLQRCADGWFSRERGLKLQA